LPKRSPRWASSTSTRWSRGRPGAWSATRSPQGDDVRQNDEPHHEPELPRPDDDPPPPPPLLLKPLLDEGGEGFGFRGIVRVDTWWKLQCSQVSVTSARPVLYSVAACRVRELVRIVFQLHPRQREYPVKMAPHLVFSTSPHVPHAQMS
jgi:hypothetical protein